MGTNGKNTREGKDSDAARPGGNGGDPKSGTPFFIRNPEAFAMNMARMVEQAGKAASAWAATPSSASTGMRWPCSAVS